MGIGRHKAQGVSGTFHFDTRHRQSQFIGSYRKKSIGNSRQQSIRWQLKLLISGHLRQGWKFLAVLSGQFEFTLVSMQLHGKCFGIQGQGYRLIRKGLEGFQQNFSWNRHLGLTIAFDRKAGPHRRV